MQFIVSGQRIAVENFVTGKLYTILWKNDTQVTLTCISIGADCVVFQGEAPLNLFTLTMQNADTIDTIEPTQLGTTNYNNLINKPSINGVDLIGNKTSSDLGIREVPAVIETDEGKVLTADDDGTYSWQELPEGTTNYNDLSNKPQINSVTLTGNVSLEDLGAAAAADIPTTPADIGAEPAITSENMLDADLVDDSNSTNKFATAAQLAQIAINETNISLIDHASGTKLYFTETEPTDNIPNGSYWISTTAIKIYNEILYNGGVVQGGWNTTTYQKTEVTDRCRIDEPIPVLTGNTYTITISDAPVETNNMFIMYYNNSNNIISNTGFISAKNGTTELSPPANSAFMTLMIANRAGTDCQPPDFGQITINHNGWN